MLVKIITPRSRRSLVSTANTEDFLCEMCSHNLTVIDNIIEPCECHNTVSTVYPTEHTHYWQQLEDNLQKKELNEIMSL